MFSWNLYLYFHDPVLEYNSSVNGSEKYYTKYIRIIYKNEFYLRYLLINASFSFWREQVYRK